MLFSADWMRAFASAWNSEPELRVQLGNIGFNSTIGYGVQGEATPRGVLVVSDGAAVDAGAYDGQPLNWDLRASEATWNDWLTKPPSMMGLGMAYTTGKLKFVAGDYAAMIKDPRMAGPFIKSFQVMGKVQ
jgi:hypothetical protein